MSSLGEELKLVRQNLGKQRPLEQFKGEILELLDKHGATQVEVQAWLEQCKDVTVSRSTLSRVIKSWREST
ncbi:MAG: arginine repressor [Reinekea sp.]|jgi:arginine repressor|uniref:Transcriptional regulator n=1 Tax=Pseudoalteromonas gelatinilytica TaxID=1703256 RepID=A0ABQ1UF91_9GAMM|nr:MULTISPECIES: hypothetical protein [Alteromonadales]MDY6975706.1 hypothetical protein [Pseudomonadota bacterium]OZB99457.1 hypothetical protein BBP29_01695 [Alteromonas macleodii]GGF14899.1 hypothetical protein GCM10008027_44630 [Pseudoalteromonas profundi]HAA96630.1 hypothetical protein [Alteromonas macleodii]HAM16897.1 hypothetical protein [Alteromonas macleodii]|tara:strand:- start:7844 stop:8056 length:213 start_codon:yes stop_codon:yes gene_type:complete